jgi:hypothetical protein
MDKDEDGLLSLADMEAGFLERGMTIVGSLFSFPALFSSLAQ